MPHVTIISLACSLIVMLCTPACVLNRQQNQQCVADDRVTYDQHIAPIMNRYCTRCHSSESAAGQFVADTYEPEDHGGTAKEKWTAAYRRVANGDMPASGAKPTSCELAALKAWVERGAVRHEGGADQCAQRVPGYTPLRRLTVEQYENTLADLFSPELAATVRAESLLAALPVEQATDNAFSSFNRDVTLSHAQTYFDVASYVSDQAQADTSWQLRLASCLSQKPISAACRDEFVANFARLALRGVAGDAALSTLREAFIEGEAEGFAVGSAVFVALQLPEFIYHLELGQPEMFIASQALVTLTPAELANRMSYLLWNRPPDALLREAAQDGTLSTPTGLRQHAERLQNDPRARVVSTRFFREWLGYGKRRGSNFSDDFRAGLDVPALYSARAQEIEDYLLTLTLDDGASYAELLTSNAAFVSSDTLASVYGVSASAQRATFSDSRRVGLLTKAALLAGGDDQTHPVQRGVFVMRKLLCRDIELPPATELAPSALKPPEFDPALSARQRWAARTEVGQCAGCHSQINPYGFVFEHYDSLGRYRERERVYDPTTHALVNEVAVDAEVQLAIDGTAVQTMRSPADLANVLSTSEVGLRCASRQWFRYALGRRETGADGCAIDASLSARSLKEQWLALVTQPDFLVRSIEPRQAGEQP